MRKKSRYPEHKLAARSKSLFSRTTTAWIVSLGGLVLGAWISVFGGDIRQSVRLFFGKPVLASSAIDQTQRHTVVALQRGGVDGWTVVFWIAAAVYAWMVYMRLRHQDARETERAMTIIRTIHRSPNVNVIRDYRDYFRACQRALLSNDVSDGLPEPERIEALAANIRGALHVMAEMAQEFARANKKVSYGANVMLVAGQPFPSTMIDALRFHPKTDTNGLLAILYLPEALTVSERDGQHARHIPCISLPVPQEEYNHRGERLALFGAPTALLRGDASVYLDTQDVSAEYADLAKPIQSDIQEYFGRDGDGRDVRSFASFRIGYDQNNPIGVVDIDCDARCVLGCDEEFYGTFGALMEPLLDMIAPQVVEYAAALSTMQTSGAGGGNSSLHSEAAALPARAPSGNVRLSPNPNPETVHDQTDIPSS
jgi:hypothetical protein